MTPEDDDIFASPILLRRHTPRWDKKSVVGASRKAPAFHSSSVSPATGTGNNVEVSPPDAAA